MGGAVYYISRHGRQRLVPEDDLDRLKGEGWRVDSKVEVEAPAKPKPKRKAKAKKD